MLEALPSTRQNENEALRRYFFSYAFDLYVWYDVNDQPISFQLAYDKWTNEHALTWHHQHGYRHYRVDDDPNGSSKMSPLLVASGPIDQVELLREFVSEAAELPDDVRQLVSERISAFGQPT